MDNPRLQIQPLFYSNLPYNCVLNIFEKFIFLNMNLPTKFKEQIIYYENFKNFLKYYPTQDLLFLESELVFRLNNMSPLCRGLSHSLKYYYPKINLNYINKIYSLNIYKSILKFWSLMSYKQQKKFLYSHLCI